MNRGRRAPTVSSSKSIFPPSVAASAQRDLGRSLWIIHFDKASNIPEHVMPVATPENYPSNSLHAGESFQGRFMALPWNAVCTPYRPRFASNTAQRQVKSNGARPQMWCSIPERVFQMAHRPALCPRDLFRSRASGGCGHEGHIWCAHSEHNAYIPWITTRIVI